MLQGGHTCEHRLPCLRGGVGVAFQWLLWSG